MLTIGPWQSLLPLVALNLMKKKEKKIFCCKKKKEEEKVKTLERNNQKYKKKRGVTCWGCGKKEHILKNCWKFQEFQKQEQAKEGQASVTTKKNEVSQSQLN